MTHQIVCDRCGKGFPYERYDQIGIHVEFKLGKIGEEKERDYCAPCTLELYTVLDKFELEGRNKDGK